MTWWATAYPAHNLGAHSPIDPERDRYVVQDLLTGRTDAHLQAMAVLMWTVTADGDPNSDWTWIATRHDRTVRVLRHKAGALDRAVALAAARPPQQLTFGAMASTPRPAPTRDPSQRRTTDVWAAIVAHLGVTEYSRTWFATATLIDDRDDVIEVAAPDAHAAYIETRYAETLREAVAAVRPGARVIFVAA